MRLLLVSDLHYALRQYDWLLDRASRYDAVVLAGDLLSIAAPVAVEVQILAIGATLRKLAESTAVIACSGNHDLNTYSAAGRRPPPGSAHSTSPGSPLTGRQSASTTT